MPTYALKVWGTAVLLAVLAASLSEQRPLLAEEIKARTTLSGHVVPIYGIAFSPDGKTLASGSEDWTIKLWEMKTGKETATLRGRGRHGGITGLSFSPDGKTLASASADSRSLGEAKDPDNTVQLWDVRSGEERVAIRRADRWAVRAVAFSPDGRLLASGGGEEFVRLWDPATGKKIATLRGRFDNGLSVDFRPDSKTIAAAGSDKVITLWDVPVFKPRKK